ncbi:MAG: hypothetical protein ACKVP0_03380 [Pirellulaceae bacterium]
MDEDKLDLRRLILIGAGLPIVAAAATYLLMHQFVVGERSVLESTIGFGGFVLEIGLVGFVVGKAMPHPQLRWLLYGWLMLLVDLLVVSMAMNSSDGYISEILAAAALVAGQVGLAIIWGTLGTNRWYWRVPLTMGLGGGLLAFWIVGVTGWSGRLMAEVLIIQSITLGLLAGALWISGYRLEIPQPDKTTGGGPRNLQFGIKDVLIWTTVLAILLGLMRGAGMLNWGTFTENPSLYLKWTVALVSAIVILFALWASLGQGHWLLRYTLLVAMLILLGAAVGGLSIYGEKLYGLWQSRSVAPGWYSYDYDLYPWKEVGWWWIAWMFLSGGLLAASLMIFRAVGYRLVKRQAASRTS